jgi:hypothetical protein
MKKLAILILFLANKSFAGMVEEGKVIAIAFNSELGNFAFVRTDVAKNNVPACHTNANWTFVLPVGTEVGRNMYSALLTAKAAGTKVRIGGSDTCSSFPSVEALTYVELKQ